MIHKYVVYANNGSVDVDASVAKFTEELTKLTETGVKSETIEAAVDTVFDKNPEKKRLPMPALINFVTAELHPSAEQIASVARQVQTWVRANAQENGRFEIVKLKGGGVGRLHLKDSTKTSG